MYFTGYIQGGLNASTTEQFNRQCEHIAHIVGETQARGLKCVEPSQEAQDAYVRHFREIEVDTSQLLAECTPSYYSNEGDTKPRWLLLRGYGHGWSAFLKLLADWRTKGNLDGLIVK
jgi:cyclohexanone monooxygenase